MLLRKSISYLQGNILIIVRLILLVAAYGFKPEAFWLKQDNMDTLDEEVQARSKANFYLMFLAIVLSLLNNYLSAILNYVLLVVKCFTTSTNDDVSKVKLAELQKESAQIDMINEFAKYARLQRKITLVQDEIKKQAQAQMESNMKRKWSLQLILWASCILLMYCYNSEPVVKFPSEWVYPISCFLSWPGSEPGVISFLVWCAISNSVIKTFT